MKSLLIYILQMIAISGILYGYYHFALRNNRFHQYNRFYLLATVVLSIVIPFLNIPFYFTPADKDSSYVLQTLTAISPVQYKEPVAYTTLPAENTSWITWPDILVIVYLLIAIIVLTRFILSLFYIRRLIRSHSTELLGSVRFVNTSEPGTPFSFFRWLFWNRSIELQSDKGQQVFRHEVFHIEQKHSYDLVFTELVTIICWFNPFLHLLKKELKAIHEFLADRFAIDEHTKWEYAEMLLMQALHTKQTLVNPFFQTHIKRRIAMITKPQTPGQHYARKLLVLPLTALVVTLFAFRYTERNSISPTPENNSNTHAMFTNDTTANGFHLRGNVVTLFEGTDNAKIDPENCIAILDGVIYPAKEIIHAMIVADTIFVYQPGNKEAIRKYGEQARNGALEYRHIRSSVVFANADTTKPGEKIYDVKGVAPSFPGGEAGWKKFLDNNLNPAPAGISDAPAGSYTAVIMFVVDITGAVSNIRPLTHHGYGMEAELVRLIQNGPKWMPARMNGKPVNSYHRQVLTFVAGKKETKTATDENTEKSPDKENMIFTKVETAPSFPGGQAKFIEYLNGYANKYKDVLEKEKQPIHYKARFIVHTDGHISDVEIIEGPAQSHGAKVIVELLTKSPSWIPAQQNGRVVKVYQEIPFVLPDPYSYVSEENKYPYLPTISYTQLKESTVRQLLHLENDVEVISYEFAIEKSGGEIAVVSNTGNNYNAATRQLIVNASAGKMITFDAIRVKVNGIEKKLPSVVYKVVD